MSLKVIKEGKTPKGYWLVADYTPEPSHVCDCGQEHFGRHIPRLCDEQHKVYSHKQERANLD